MKSEKQKHTLKSFRELSAASLAAGDKNKPADRVSPPAVSPDERAHLPLAYSMALSQATTRRGLPVRTPLSVASG